MHCGMRAQHRLYFAQLDPEAANLHLLIGSANKLDLAVIAIPGKIAGPVQHLAATGLNWIDDKFLGRQLGTPPVAASNTCAADI